MKKAIVLAVLFLASCGAGENTPVRAPPPSAPAESTHDMPVLEGEAAKALLAG